MHLNFKYLLAIFSTEATVFIFGGLLNKKEYDVASYTSQK